MSHQPPDSEELKEATQHTNRLIHEASPYLLQHAHNPVDWYPWGAEALERAKREDKPILLSVGYSACHWCHVMAHESFENEDTARLMNELFVNIKVDREERPDIDALYMDAVQAMTGSGGWPMTVLLTPDGAPFYGGTYFPPRERYGMPGFPQVLRSVADFYRTRRDEVEQQAEQFRAYYRDRGETPLPLPEGIVPAEVRVHPDVLDAAADRLLAQLDAVNGGFGRAPKFPQPMALAFLLRVYSRNAAGHEERNARLLSLVRLTLDKMAAGGIYDQVGGGFHRYATDAHWLVPHFEKMLYDNALLAPVYLHAWQITGGGRYRRVCEEILDYVVREMTDPAGGFYSTQDADSGGEEGRFYVWTPAELLEALGDADAAIVGDLWGVSDRGNFEGRNILHLARDESDVAAAHGLSMDDLHALESRAREKLYAARSQRIWPGRDDKVITAWNGLMLRAMAEAARALDRADYQQTAVANATFLTEHMLAGGRLQRTWRGGPPRNGAAGSLRATAKLDGYLEDYAAVANGLLSLYEDTGDVRWFSVARGLADDMLDRFWDDARNSFFDTAADHEVLIGRPRELTDNATPSGSSLAAEALLRLAAFTGEDRYRDTAVRVLLPLAAAMAEQPSAFGHFLSALDDLVGPLHEVAVVGASDDPAFHSLRHTVASRYLPRTVLAYAPPNDGSAAAVPLLADRGLVDGRPAAYVCEGFVCRQPVTTPDALLTHLA
jgi:uncharacterized protein